MGFILPATSAAPLSWITRTGGFATPGYPGLALSAALYILSALFIYILSNYCTRRIYVPFPEVASILASNCLFYLIITASRFNWPRGFLWDHLFNIELGDITPGQALFDTERNRSSYKRNIATGGCKSPDFVVVSLKLNIKLLITLIQMNEINA